MISKAHSTAKQLLPDVMQVTDVAIVLCTTKMPALHGGSTTAAAAAAEVVWVCRLTRICTAKAPVLLGKAQVHVQCNKGVMAAV
jgi:hypothetical protein